ncbi:hypothetical protein ACRRTK_012783 [Alexandromys fortis]
MTSDPVCPPGKAGPKKNHPNGMSFGPHEMKKIYLRHFGEENLTFLSSSIRVSLREE